MQVAELLGPGEPIQLYFLTNQIRGGLKMVLFDRSRFEIFKQIGADPEKFEKTPVVYSGDRRKLIHVKNLMSGSCQTHFKLNAASFT
jgi:hypothetical protein